MITKKQLLEKLAPLDDDDLIGVGYNYGDYRRSTAIISPNSLDWEHVRYSTNLQCYVVTDNPDSGDELIAILTE